MRIRPALLAWRLERARRLARQEISECGVSAPGDIRLWSICRKHGVEVKVAPLDGVDAQYVRIGRRAKILLSNRITDRKKRWFDAAHELGHHVLGHPTQLSKPAKSSRDSIYELEANAFASELLMPEWLVRRDVDLSRLDLSPAQQISDLFKVSILAAAIRVTELAGEPCAAVFSVANENGGGEVGWVRTSSHFNYSIEPGAPLSSLALASAWFEIGEVDHYPHDVPPLAWFGAKQDVRLIEHATSSREYNTVLSMLWIPRSAS
jgi:Zn-dependent peptidase ImmA (M78 family)